MVARVWDVVKATLAVAALIGAALVSADKLDRQRAQPVAAAGYADPISTGALGTQPAR